MGLKFVSENLGALAATDALGNTGFLQKRSTDPIRSLVFFNNSAHKQYLQVDTPNSIPVQIPASTSLSLTFADLIVEDVHEINVYGTSADLVTVVYVTGSLQSIRKGLALAGLITGS
jgi:hypothetical protein